MRVHVGAERRRGCRALIENLQSERVHIANSSGRLAELDALIKELEGKCRDAVGRRRKDAPTLRPRRSRCASELRQV